MISNSRTNEMRFCRNDWPGWLFSCSQPLCDSAGNKIDSWYFLFLFFLIHPPPPTNRVDLGFFFCFINCPISLYCLFFWFHTFSDFTPVYRSSLRALLTGFGKLLWPFLQDIPCRWVGLSLVLEILWVSLRFKKDRISRKTIFYRGFFPNRSEAQGLLFVWEMLWDSMRLGLHFGPKKKTDPRQLLILPVFFEQKWRPN